MDNPAISLGKKQFGSSAALPIWATTMKDIYNIGEFYINENELIKLEKNLNWNQPNGIVDFEICSETYKKPTDWCPVKKECKYFQR